MRPDELLDHLRERPFQPFRLHLTDGTTYEIRHPERIKVFRSKAHVFCHRNDQPGDLVLRYEAIALVHINRLVPVGPAPTSNPVAGSPSA